MNLRQGPPIITGSDYCDIGTVSEGDDKLALCFKATYDYGSQKGWSVTCGYPGYIRPSGHQRSEWPGVIMTNWTVPATPAKPPTTKAFTCAATQVMWAAAQAALEAGDVHAFTFQIYALAMYEQGPFIEYIDRQAVNRGPEGWYRWAGAYASAPQTCLGGQVEVTKRIDCGRPRDA